MAFQHLAIEYLKNVAQSLGEEKRSGFATLVMPDHFSLRSESVAFLRRDGLPPTPAVIDYIRGLGELGIDEVMVRAPMDLATFDLLATELVPMVAKIAVAGR